MKLLKLNFLLSLLFISSTLFSQSFKRVLFLGNSYTAANDLPGLVKSLTESAGDSLYVESNTPGGYTLQGHSTNAGSLALIQQGGWDYVVLQEQSQLPSFPDYQVATEVYPYAKTLDSLIHLSNPCAKTVFYMTWGRKNGDADNCSSWPPVCTYMGMDSLLNLRYTNMANYNKSWLCPAGYAWRYCRQNFASIELYDSDESHPSFAGSYLTAACFYTIFFQKSPNLITKNISLDATTAQNLRQIANVIVYDSLLNWNVGKWNPIANFSINQNGASINCSNISQNADTYMWNFGDGSTSILENPVHTYQNSASFVVKLEASKCGLTDTISKPIVITNLDDKEIDDFIKIFPNPSDGKIKLEGAKDFDRIEIYNSAGLIIFSSENTKNQKEINLPKGSYICKIKTKKYETSAKIIVQ